MSRLTISICVARGSLEAALREFDGTVLFVSHDRYFLNQIADHLIVVEPNGSFRVIDGNYNTLPQLSGSRNCRRTTSECGGSCKARRKRQGGCLD